jgi:hypothetical protein
MTIKAHFDGKVFIPDEPVDLPKDQPVDLNFQPVPAPSRKMGTTRDLLESGLVGIWADRTDITDSLEYARELRRKAERREI